MENVKQKNFENFEIFIEINFGLLKQFYLILSGRNFWKKKLFHNLCNVTMVLSCDVIKCKNGKHVIMDQYCTRILLSNELEC